MNDKKMLVISYDVIVVALLAFGFICWRILHHNGAGTDTTGNQLGQAQNAAQSVTSSISTAQDTAGEIRQSSQDIGTTIGSIQGTLYSTGDSIENCERILAGIRARGKAKN